MKMFFCFGFVLLFVTSIVVADTISVNSGGSTNLMITPNPYMFGYLYSWEVFAGTQSGSGGKAGFYDVIVETVSEEYQQGD